ncbi:MAG: DeoR/GlpR transcriptional regulator [Ekhidna sp.]|nr:DeoR/GlpR transcriptional regulator [Ekhidna sp.]MBC6410060.1 DeoR/GlpR transcriptional regulator [Ekhidna sp.]MBC6427526.1 DeoR/GlpR transcriptional regulator [Ekhidna sp.]
MNRKEERHRHIIHEIQLHNRVLLTDLADVLNVSKDTVRRDIQELHDQNKLKKVHGGAISSAFNSSGGDQTGVIYASEIKSKIAQKALDIIAPDGVNLISGGTTNLELIKRLPRALSATFFTPSLVAAMELSLHPNIEVILIGGRLSNQSQISIGGSALNLLSSIKADTCFLGTGWLDSVNGLTEIDWEVVQLKKAMINASKKVVSLTISEKLNTWQRFKVCEIQSIDTLVTELDPDSDLLKPYLNQNLEIL